ncbi:hypothetical protein ALC57_18118 [Trachymyrmex cornetzi]|uniref:Uncharacterized protein n=1 Tax=Trachymyrmex cornetzi TaxID=471704 RepID=A0A151ISC0_9HYME|nr:hypothetical protein ALC57_18118 [Trachymyrmex cornetzi]
MKAPSPTITPTGPNKFVGDTLCTLVRCTESRRACDIGEELHHSTSRIHQLHRHLKRAVGASQPKSL